MTLPLIHLTGSPYEQGRQHGRALQKQIGHNLDVYFDRFLREGGVSRAEVLQRAARYAEAIAAQSAAYTAGMEGIAAGSGTSLAEIVALNVRYEILYYQYAIQKGAATDGCTAFALAPEATANGHLLLGQNWDWIPEVAGAILDTTDPDGFRTLAFTEAGIFGGKIGLNTAGLGLAINGITTMADEWTRLEKPFHLRCYQILRARSLEAALEVVTGTPRACSANYLIAQVPDRAIDVEAAPEVINRLGWQQEQIVHANHFLDPAGLGVAEPPDPEHRQRSRRRQERLEQLLAEKRPVRVADVQAALRDHNTAPRHICRHEEPGAPVDEQYRTVTSIVMDLAAGELYATDGPPCEGEYSLFGLRQDRQREYKTKNGGSDASTEQW